MNIDREQLLTDLIKARNSMIHASSKDDIFYTFESFDILNTIYGSLTGLQFDTDKIFLANDYYKKMIDKQYFKSILEFYGYTHNNAEEIKEIFKNYDNLMENVNFLIYPFYNNMKRYDEKTSVDIILSFYSKYGNKIYNAVKKYFDENRIEMSYKKVNDLDLAAAYTNFTLFDTGYIVSIHNNFNTWSIMDLVHELGHAVDAELFLFPQKKKMSIFSDILCEVPSTTFEMDFLDYLIDNKIDDNAIVIKNYRHSLLADASDELNYLYSLKKIDTDYEGNLYDENGMVYPFREMLLYGLGYYVTFHLIALKKNMNVKDFNKMFFDIISSRKEYSKITEVAEKMGISEDEFLSSNLIKDDVVKNQKLLKQKYPYHGGYNEQ